MRHRTTPSRLCGRRVNQKSAILSPKRPSTLVRLRSRAFIPSHASVWASRWFDHLDSGRLVGRIWMAGQAEAWRGILIGGLKLHAVRCGARSSLCLHITAFGAYFRIKEPSILDILNTPAGDGGRRSLMLLAHRPTVEEHRHFDGYYIFLKS